jgi:hypothetical protein
MEFTTYGDFEDIHDAAVEPARSVGVTARWRRLLRRLAGMQENKAGAVRQSPLCYAQTGEDPWNPSRS